MPVPMRFRPDLISVVDKLVNGDYLGLETDGLAGRVGADSLKGAINEYGRTLVILPTEAFEIADARERQSQPGNWAVALDLWTAEEGRSDLTLILSVTDLGNIYKIEIDDLRVM